MEDPEPQTQIEKIPSSRIDTMGPILIHLLYTLYVPLRVPRKAKESMLGGHTSNLRHQRELQGAS